MEHSVKNTPSVFRRAAAAAALAAAAAFALPASAARTGAAVYRPGLVQARIPFPSEFGYLTAYDGVPNLASNLLAVADESWLDRTLDVFKDGENANGATNVVSGKTWPWLIEHNHGVFAYEGEIWLEAGVDYGFFGRNHNGEALVIDGRTLVWQGRRNAWQYVPEIREAWTPERSGWYPFNGWLWSWNGSCGPVGGKTEWGLQYNTVGFVAPTNDVYGTQAGATNIWLRFADPGNGTFFRSATGERFTAVGASAAAQGGRSFDLAFAGVPTNAQLVAFTGPADGFHDPGNWAAQSAVLAEVPPGTSTTNVVVPLAADAKVLRFRLAHFDAASTNGLDVFEEWTEMIAVSPSPVVSLASVSPGWTNAVVAGSLDSFGIGGVRAAVTVEIAAASDASFSSPVASATLPAAEAVGPFSVDLFGLATNAAFLVRAKALNDRNETGHSAVLSFSTKDPGPPEAALETTVRGYQTATFRATVSGWGGGSWSAEAWLDVSEDAAFPAGATQTLPLGSLSGALPAAVAATADGLEPDTDHYARLRVTNSWGVAFASETVPFRTSDVPLGFDEPVVVASIGHVSAALSPSFVSPGTVYTVALFAKGPGYEGTWATWDSRTDDPPFEWGRRTAAGEDVLIRYTVDWSYPATGVSGRIVIEATTAAKLADYTVENLPGIDPAAGGPYLRPGQTVEIRPSDGARLDWHTNAVLRIAPTNGVYLLEALEPGVALLYESGANGNPNGVTGVAIVVPAADPAGGVYVHRGYDDWTWTDSSQWDVVVAGPQGYPDAVGAVAYVVAPQIADATDHTIEITKPITLGHLAVGELGWIHHGFNTKTQFYLQFVDTMAAGGSFLFKTDDGSPSWIRLLGHCYVASPLKMNVPVTLANDLDLDALGRIPDSDGWKSWRDHGFKINAPLDFGPYTFRTIRDTYYYGRGNLYTRGFITINDDIRGSGTIRLEADTAVGMNDGSDASRLKSFTGVWDVANGQFNVSGYGGSGLSFGDACLGNASEIVFRGAWHPADASENKGAHSRSGYSGEGAWTNDWHGILPSKVTLDGAWIVLGPRGGTMDAAAKAAYQATGIRRAHYEIGELVVPAGPQGRLETARYGSSTDYPDNLVDITNLVMDANAVLSFTLADSSGSVLNEVFIHDDPPSFYADPDEDIQFLPQFFANHEADTNDKLIFRDPGTGLLEKRSAGTGDDAPYRRWTASATLGGNAEFRSMQLAANVALSFPAAGSVATDLSGYLDMRNGAAVGALGDAASATSTLDFGDAIARVYVGKRADAATIGCKLRGSAGLVKGGSGTLAIGASAEGLAGGIRVAGGTLALGALDGGNVLHPARVAGDVVVESGSRIVVRDTKAFAPDARLFLNDRDWIPSHAHVRLETNASAGKLFLDGTPMPNGYYGSSESAAANVDDVHFEGPGILWAGVRPTMLILK